MWFSVSGLTCTFNYVWYDVVEVHKSICVSRFQDLHVGVYFCVVMYWKYRNICAFSVSKICKHVRVLSCVVI